MCEGREDTFSFRRHIVRRAAPEAETSVVVIFIWVQIRLATQRKNLSDTHHRRHQTISEEWIFPTTVIRIQQQDARGVATATTTAVHRAPRKIGKYTGPQVHHTGGIVRRGSRINIIGDLRRTKVHIEQATCRDNLENVFRPHMGARGNMLCCIA